MNNNIVINPNLKKKPIPPKSPVDTNLVTISHLVHSKVSSFKEIIESTTKHINLNKIFDVLDSNEVTKCCFDHFAFVNDNDVGRPIDGEQNCCERHPCP